MGERIPGVAAPGQAAGLPSGATRLNPRADYDRTLDALTTAKAQAGVKNAATAFGLLLDLAEKHLEEIPKPAAEKT